MDGSPVSTDVLDPDMIRLRCRTGAPTQQPADLNDSARLGEVQPATSRNDPARDERKPPPPPRAVVDVFRGDKHVQEVFHD